MLNIIFTSMQLGISQPVNHGHLIKYLSRKFACLAEIFNSGNIGRKEPGKHILEGGPVTGKFSLLT